MRAAAPIAVTVTCFGVWRMLLGCSGALASMSLMAWFAARGVPAAAWCLVLLPIVLMLSLRSTLQPFHLAWDGRDWRLSEVNVGDATSRDGRPGRVDLAIDLGGWMLLRWRAHASGWPASSTWLPVQRRGLESHWHVLRCAVYARPATASRDAAADL